MFRLVNSRIYSSFLDNNDKDKGDWESDDDWDAFDDEKDDRVHELGTDSAVEKTNAIFYRGRISQFWLWKDQ